MTHSREHYNVAPPTNREESAMDINDETRDKITEYAQSIIEDAEKITDIINLPNPTPDDPDSVAIYEWATDIVANAHFIAGKLLKAVPRTKLKL